MSQNEKITENGPLISLLENSPYYFLQCAYLLQLDNHFRLVVIHYGKVLIDNIYDTIIGAKIAFSRVFKKRSWNEKVKPEWTAFFCPDKKWLEEKAA